ncbi:MAG: ABC transporter ATP-binding protein [Bradymonadaceae bacterium]
MKLIATKIEHGFGPAPLLRGIDLELHPGEAVAIVGPNGVGKTTLIRLIAGLLTIQRGEVLLDDTPLGDLTRRRIARQIAIVPQARHQVFDFSAIELVLMGFHARSARFSLPSSAQEEAAARAMDRLAIADLKHRPASVLSGGELQRVLMARAMVSLAPIWLLDEPTSNLDLKHQLALLDMVREHCDTGGSALAVLHDLPTVHRFFDRVLVLHEGRIAAQGAPDDVLTPEVVSEVFETPMIRGMVDGRVVWVGA